MMASDDNLVPRKEATSILLKWFGYKKSDLWADLEKNRNDKLHNSNQKQTIQYNQCKKAYKEQVLTTGSV